MSDDRRVLFVEDDGDLADLYAMTMEDMNFQYYVAKSKRDLDEVLLRLKKMNVSVTKVLLDINVAGLNLPETVVELRRNPVTSSATIILVSAATKIESISSELGIEKFLKKPFNYDDLLTILA